jgi:hypothetical protein
MNVGDVIPTSDVLPFSGFMNDPTDDFSLRVVLKNALAVHAVLGKTWNKVKAFIPGNFVKIR